MKTLLKESEAEAGHALGFYTVGGTLRSDVQSYVKRQADVDLYNNLTRGHFCYALGQRQMGKSSLMVQTAVRLRMEGVAVAVLDLTAIGFNISTEQWYEGLLARIGEQLNLEEELEDCWMDHARLSPLQRWMAAITKVVLRLCKGNVVIFIDEVDAVLSLPFQTDEFFAGIRELYNRRTDEPELNRLTFCLLGVATPSDLVRDIRVTPFNIGKRIDLTDFTESEAALLARGWMVQAERGTELIKRVIHWTGGHPYLTQHLCQALSDEASLYPDIVDRVCNNQFFSSRTREQNDNLRVVSNRILRGDARDTAGLLSLYAGIHRYNGVGSLLPSIERLWRRFRRMRVDETSHLCSILWLSGIVRVTEGYLYVRNRIYHRVFNQEWVKENMPDAELRRQRAAYRQGVIRGVLIATLIFVLTLSLFIFAQRDPGLRLP
jgi:AAA-like domain